MKILTCKEPPHWRSQALSGGATRPPGKTKMRKKMKKLWAKMRETVAKWGKIEEMFLSCPPGSERLATALNHGPTYGAMRRIYLLRKSIWLCGTWRPFHSTLPNGNNWRIRPATDGHLYKCLGQTSHWKWRLKSLAIQIEKVVRQGDTMSPKIFTVAMEDII